MRVPKYKAWIKSEGHEGYMTEVTGINFPTGFILIPMSDDPRESRRIDFEECTLLLFTGLRDINKKEIYEGDIVNARIYGDDPFNPQPIYYEGSAFWVDYKFPDFDRTSLCCFPEGVEVIGNIYENPELLK